MLHVYVCVTVCYDYMCYYVCYFIHYCVCAIQDTQCVLLHRTWYSSS